MVGMHQPRAVQALVWALVGGLAGVCAMPSLAVASEVRVVSRTMGEGYQVLVPGPSRQLLGRRRLVQYVDLGVYNLLPPRRPEDGPLRDPEDGQLEIVSSLRLRHDFGTFTREATGASRELLESLDGRQIDVLYGYLEGRRLARFLDLRIGRQFEMSGLDFFAFDGGLVRAVTPAHFAIEVFGGVAVDGSAVFGYPTFELDGQRDEPNVSPIVGAAVSLVDMSFADARIAYRRTWTPGSDPDDTTVDQELISASFALRLAKQRVQPFIAGRYNLGVSRLDDLSAGIAWTLTDLHRLRVFFWRSQPMFDLDSIFNVFAYEPSEDVRLIYEVRPSDRWTFTARGQLRLLHAEPTAELQTAPTDPVAFGGGGGLSAAYRRRRFAMRLDAYGQGGSGGIRVGGSVDTRTHVFYDRVAIDARGFAAYYEPEDRGVSDYSVAFQVGTHVHLAHGIYVHALAEELVSGSLKHSLRLFGMLSMDWAFRVGQR